MLAIWVKVHVKPEERQRFLGAIEADALGSERDEPGCLRFNVLQDGQDENVYYFFEVYEDEAVLEAHRGMPHFEAWRAAFPDCMRSFTSTPAVSSFRTTSVRPSRTAKNKGVKPDLSGVRKSAPASINASTTGR